ncbi:MAG: bifunctional glutamate N-acetyltransferase/amino-acid acetyltransferase ArgJ [Dehalococcoidia bacterium]
MARTTARSGIEEIQRGSISSPQGFVAGAVYAGIKTYGENKLDVGIVASTRPATCAAMFTRSKVRSAAVMVSEMHARRGSARAIIVNAGISNVATGADGIRDATEMAELVAGKLGINRRDVIVGSTGIIGHPLPMAKIRDAAARIELRADGGHEFARAILTTDTHAKEIAVRFRANRQDYILAGCAKGSGMIHPDMATMFCFMTTDAPVQQRYLRTVLTDAIDDSLNMISVDGDTSTSDTTAVIANGAAGGPPIDPASLGASAFEAALRHVCTALARMLARDGEGAQKLIEVQVEGAASDKDARAAARTVTASPLVKSAVHGNDPNWGRVLMAVGRSGARINVDRASVWLGEARVFDGLPVKFDARAVSRYLRNEEVLIRVHLGAGAATATAWGCDLTPEYVHINSDYTT